PSCCRSPTRRDGWSCAGRRCVGLNEADRGAGPMIVIFGSLNVDQLIPVDRLPHPGETVMGPSYSFAAGGKGANQALDAARAGANVRMAGRVGTDDLSVIALNDLQ